MARIAIGDVQGCLPELRQLLGRMGFSADRDELWFVGDLVNRGPDSLGVLRFVRSLGDNAKAVLGNHDLHLLAVALGGGTRRLRHDDTLEAVLAAPDRDTLLEWLLQRPLAIADGPTGDLMIHAGIVPSWTVPRALQLAAEVGARLRRSPEAVLSAMYGNRPDRWDDSLSGSDRDRFVINVLTRLRFCQSDGRVDMKLKGRPGSQPAGWLPWFDVPGRASAGARVIFGHWSTLGLLERPRLLGLDTGCVWGGALTARSLDDERSWQQPCAGYQSPGND